MKFRFNPIVAALFAAGAFPLAHGAAIASAPAAHNEVHTVIINGDTVIENVHAGQGNANVVIAQSGTVGNRKDVKVITTGQPGSFPDLANLTNLPDMDVIISSAVSEAFAGGMTMQTAKSVKNAPYSAEVISEKIQTLPDGNQISRKTSTMAYRDAAGRTRQETRDSKGEVKSIHINDAVEGARYVLSPSKKSATKIGIDKDLQKRIEEIKEKAKAMAKDGKAHIIERSNPGEEIIVKRIEGSSDDGRRELREEVKVNVVRSGSGAAPAGAYAYRFGDGESVTHAFNESLRQGPIGWSFQDIKWSSKSTKTQLGVKDFDGVRAEGKSVSYTIPAGEIGNKNPIVVSNETWTSPDLQVVVYSKHSDPRSGDSIYRLANVKRVEQPATLFMVPDGYSVKETPGMAWSAKTK